MKISLMIGSGDRPSDTTPPAPPSEGQTTQEERVPVSAIVDYLNWLPFDVAIISDDPTVDSNATYHGSVNGGTAAIRCTFNTPLITPSGTQYFRVRASGSVSGLSLRAELYAAGTFVRNLGTVSCSTSPSIMTWSWLAAEVSSPADVEIRLVLVDGVSGAYYTIQAIDWLARATSAPPAQIGWVRGWGARPPLGSHHGIGQPFNVAYDSQGQLVWYPLRDYNNWLGRPANIIKVWPLMSGSGNDTWDAIAGGAGSSDTTWSGQLNELNPNRAFDPSYWPVSLPIVFALTAVPRSHSNAWNSSTGQWGRPGIWQEIASGAYDTYYQRLFRRIATKCGATGRDPITVVLRWCWEANGDWYPHSIGPDKANFIAAWRRCMDIMRSAVGAVLGAGKTFLIEFGPSGHLRFGNGSSERLWNVYPGDDWVDICGLGIHDQVGITTQADWDEYLTYPASIAGTTFDGMQDWFDFGASRNKWLGTSEIESNYNSRTYFPKTQNMDVMWRTGFEILRQRYPGRFVYFIYLWNGASALKRADGWGEPYRLLYRP